MENREKTQDTIKELSSSKITIKASDQLLKDLYDKGYIKSYISKYFDKIYLINVNPEDTEVNIKYPNIQKIANKYKQKAENQPMQIMFFRLNDHGVEKRIETYNKMRELYWDIVSLDDSEYYVVIWYFGWSWGRKNQEVIREIQEMFDVKDLKI